MVWLLLLVALALLGIGMLTRWAGRSAAAQGRCAPRWYRHDRRMLVAGAASFALAVVLAVTTMPSPRVLLGPSVVVGLLVVADLALRRTRPAVRAARTPGP